MILDKTALTFVTRPHEPSRTSDRVVINVSHEVAHFMLPELVEHRRVIYGDEELSWADRQRENTMRFFNTAPLYRSVRG
jgi:hypothetical protein